MSSEATPENATDLFAPRRKLHWPDWSKTTLRDVEVPSEGIGGVAVVTCEDARRARRYRYVLKGASDVAREAWALRVADALDLKTPAFYILSAGEKKYVDVQHFLLKNEHDDGVVDETASTKLRRVFSFSRILIMEYIECSLMLNQLSCRADITPAKSARHVLGEKRILFQLGQLMALDVFLHNADGVPACLRTLGKLNVPLMVDSEAMITFSLTR